MLTILQIWENIIPPNCFYLFTNFNFFFKFSKTVKKLVRETMTGELTSAKLSFLGDMGLDEDAVTEELIHKVMT